VNVTITPPLLLDRRKRSRALCVAADAAIRKGDLELGQRLLIQADVDDPRNRYPEKRLRTLLTPSVWFKLIGRLRSKKQEPKPKGRKFDFLYAPTLRGLSTELSSLLPLHPNAFCVSKTELDGAIEHATEPALLRKYQRQLLNYRSRLKAGLVQHAYIAGQRAGPEVAERLASVTTRELFVHGVRDPLGLVISEFNHELTAQHCGAYQFWPIDSDSLFCRGEYTLAGSPKYKGIINQVNGNWLGNTQSARSELMQTLLGESLSRARHFAVGNTYAQHFDSWMPVNLERPPPGQPDVLSRVFEAIGVDSRFRHPAFAVSEGTTIHRLMVQNWLAVDAFGYTLFVGLGFADRMMFSNTFLMSEILTFQPDDRFAAVGLGDRPLCATVQHAQWQLLPREVRIRLVESDELQKFVALILIPAWFKSYARWKSTMDKLLLRELQPADLARLRAQIGPDLERFLKRHPQFEKIWSSTRTILGS
jgi:hypothetical protein